MTDEITPCEAKTICPYHHDIVARLDALDRTTEAVLGLRDVVKQLTNEVSELREIVARRLRASLPVQEPRFLLWARSCSVILAASLVAFAVAHWMVVRWLL